MSALTPEEWKAYLKGLPFFRNINPHLKCLLTRLSYEFLAFKYGRTQTIVPLAAALGSFASRLDRDHYRFLSLSKDERPHLFWVGGNPDQEAQGTTQSLQEIADVTFFYADADHWGQIPNVRPGGRGGRSRQSSRLYEQVMSAHRQKPLFMVLGQMWGAAIEGSVLKKIRDAGIVTANIAMDDRHQFQGKYQWGTRTGVLPLIPGLTFALTTAPECVAWYEHFDCPAFFFPLGSSPQLFSPPRKLTRDIDVLFVGARYGIREKIVMNLREAGVAVQAYGKGWENGYLATEDVPKHFSQAKIALGVGTVGHCESFYSLKLRDFDAPMAGACYITTDNPDLYQLFDVGKEMITYKTLRECVDKVVYLLDHDLERETIAKQGHARAMQDHTWRHRFQTLVDALRN